MRFMLRDVKRCGFSSGCKSHPANSVAPAGSYRSGGGGNETVGAFETTGRFGGPASGQAVTRVNAEQASKAMMREPTRQHNGEGRRHWQNGGHTPRSDLSQWSRRGSGDGMPANGNPAQHVKPHAAAGVTADRKPVRDRPGRLG